MKPPGLGVVHLLGAVTALAAVTAYGVPRYEDRLLKTQVAEALQLADATRSRVEALYAGSRRAQASEAEVAAVALHAAATPEFIREVTVIPGNEPGEVTIAVYFNRDALAVAVARDSHLFLTGSPAAAASAPSRWRCGAAGLDPAHLPASCR